MRRKEVLIQLEKLREYTEIDKNWIIDESWKSHLKEIVKKYIDENSTFIQQIDNIKFSVSSIQKPSDEDFDASYNQSKHRASILVFNIMKYIENNGIKKTSFSSKISENWKIAFVTITISVLIAFFTMFYSNKSGSEDKDDSEERAVNNDTIKNSPIDSTTTTPISEPAYKSRSNN